MLELGSFGLSLARTSALWGSLVVGRVHVFSDSSSSDGTTVMEASLCSGSPDGSNDRGKARCREGVAAADALEHAARELSR